MLKVVLDTDVVSFLFKNDSRAKIYQPYLIGQIPVISFMTVAELDMWAIERNWGEVKQNKLKEHIRKFIVMPFNRNLCLK